MKITIRHQEKNLAAILWDLQRFGFTPAKMMQRARRARGASTNLRPVLLCSVPKAGTHLAETVLCMHHAIYRPFLPTIEDRNLERLGGLEYILSRARPGHLLVSHLPYRVETRDLARYYGVNVIYLKRDPRAILASDVRYIGSRRDHYLNAIQATRTSVDEKIRMQLEGVAEVGVPPFRQRLRAYLPWEREPGVLTLRYEELGRVRDPEQGCDAVALLETLFAFCGAPTAKGWLRDLPARLPTSATPTFRKGTTDGWRRELSPDVIAVIEADLGAVLEEFGYRA